MNLDLQVFQLDLLLSGLGLTALLLVASEVGFRLGKRYKPGQVTDAVRNQFTAVEGAEFALVGLLLAFTFSMSASRYESRKQVIVAEANAIGTAYLRAKVLNAEECRQLQTALREYVDTWLELANWGGDQNRWDAATRKAAALQDRMWAISAGACQRDPHSVPASLTLSALNDVFDRHSDALFAFSNRLPGAIMMVLVVVATIALGHIGYGYGMAGRRSLSTIGILCCLIVVTIVVILDFDRSRRGMFQIVPQSMNDLRRSMAEPQG